jgi:hypothetical protein
MKRFSSFRDFYPFYLSQHTNTVCRNLHIAGSLLGLAVTVYAITTAAWSAALLGPVVGYGFSWTGHFVFEKNKPATFNWPWYSFLGDWMMVWETMTRRHSMASAQHKDMH